MADNEAFYDEVVGPALLALAKQCEEPGMPFLAIAGYNDDGNISTTATMPARAPATIRYAHGLTKAWMPGGSVNFDGFMFAVMREARESGHSSIILHQLGVPTQPKAA